MPSDDEDARVISVQNVDSSNCSKLKQDSGNSQN